LAAADGRRSQHHNHDWTHVPGISERSAPPCSQNADPPKPDCAEALSDFSVSLFWKISELSMKLTMFIENAEAASYAWLATAPAAPLACEWLVMGTPGWLLEGCFCSEAFATTGGST